LLLAGRDGKRLGWGSLQGNGTRLPADAGGRVVIANEAGATAAPMTRPSILELQVHTGSKYLPVVYWDLQFF
jgi:hypothetical protein